MQSKYKQVIIITIAQFYFRHKEKWWFLRKYFKMVLKYFIMRHKINKTIFKLIH